MEIHLVDGTYELFRHFYALPSHRAPSGLEVAATRGVLSSLLSLLEQGASHVGVATDRVIESFRNALYPGYKTGEGIDPDLHAQFRPLEDAVEAAGFALFAMVEYEADDALAAAAARAADDPRVHKVWICTPDKDLAQCVRGTRVVQLDRRKRAVLDDAGVRAKYGVSPGSIPDYLALVGDSADGFPGLPGWGAKSAAAVLAHYGKLERIPDSADDWAVRPRGAARLADTLRAQRENALLFRTLATLEAQGPQVGGVDDWRYRAPRAGAREALAAIDALRLLPRLEELASARREPGSR